MRDEKKQQKEALKEEMLRLGNLQRECKEEKIPVYITFDGYDGAGKGVQIGRLMQALDPRGFDVYTGDKDTEEEALRPFLWRFAVHAPAAPLCPPADREAFAEFHKRDPSHSPDTNPFCQYCPQTVDLLQKVFSGFPRTDTFPPCCGRSKSSRENKGFQNEVSLLLLSMSLFALMLFQTYARFVHHMGLVLLPPKQDRRILLSENK